MLCTYMLNEHTSTHFSLQLKIFEVYIDILHVLLTTCHSLARLISLVQQQLPASSYLDWMQAVQNNAEILLVILPTQECPYIVNTTVE